MKRTIDEVILDLKIAPCTATNSVIMESDPCTLLQVCEELEAANAELQRAHSRRFVRYIK
mgnify:CR=1 FL=1